MSIIHISYTKFYLYKGVTIDWHNYLGPTVLNRHTEKERHYRNISLRVWSLVNKFARLSKSEKEEYRIS